MKIIVLKPHSLDSENYWSSLTRLGHQINLIQYDSLLHDQHHEIITFMQSNKPDVAIYIGACEASFGLPTIRPDDLCRIRDLVPLIHMCGDAGDEPWWDQLRLYDQRECFTVQVSIDGVWNTPIAEFKNGMIKLTPINADYFPAVPYEARSIFVGLTGGVGHSERGSIMSALKPLGFVQHMEKQPYTVMAGFMCNCKVIVNCPMRGSGRGDQVKGRVLETGWARAVLFERENPHTRDWFEPGTDYFEYKDLPDLLEQLGHIALDENYGRNSLGMVAENLHLKLVKNHHPRIFWHDVFKKAGINVQSIAQ